MGPLKNQALTPFESFILRCGVQRRPADARDPTWWFLSPAAAIGREGPNEVLGINPGIGPLKGNRQLDGIGVVPRFCG